MTNKLTQKLYFPVLAIGLILSNGCSPKYNAASNTGNFKGLKDYYKNYFPIGVAVSTASIHGADSALIVKEFNSVTPENDMKMGPIHPSENVYNWKNADAISKSGATTYVGMHRKPTGCLPAQTESR
jgi:endo-1,4-beta-xylanase